MFPSPTAITELILNSNKISSVAGVNIPSSISKLDLSGNDIVFLDFNINTALAASGGSQITVGNLNLPTGIQCIPKSDLRAWVNSRTSLSLPGCKWIVTKCDMNADGSELTPTKVSSSGTAIPWDVSTMSTRMVTRSVLPTLTSVASGSVHTQEQPSTELAAVPALQRRLI